MIMYRAQDKCAALYSTVEQIFAIFEIGHIAGD